MRLLRILFGNNNETIPDLIIRTFGFLTKNYGFKIIKSEKNNIYKGDYLFIYCNDNSELQIEICADNSFFHCEIRRLLNGEPAKYSDKENCIGFESLAIIESNNNYDSSAYWANGLLGLKEVLKNTAYLFRRHETFFTTNCWIDVKKIEQLKNEEFKKRHGFDPVENKNKPTYFEELKKEAFKFLSDNDFILILDNMELPFYDERSTTKNVIFKKGDNEIKLSQQDWKDEYYIYNIEINNNKVFEISLRQYQDIPEAVELTMQKLRSLIP